MSASSVVAANVLVGEFGAIAVMRGAEMRGQEPAESLQLVIDDLGRPALSVNGNKVLVIMDEYVLDHLISTKPYVGVFVAEDEYQMRPYAEIMLERDALLLFMGRWQALSQMPAAL